MHAAWRQIQDNRGIKNEDVHLCARRPRGADRRRNAAQARPLSPTSRTTSSSSSTRSVQAGPDKVIAVRLMNTRTGKPVPDAVIFATRLDMAPDGMQEMATKVAPVPGDRARHLHVQGDFRHGRPLAAFARRQGPGRDRHGREQARHHGAEMSRALLASRGRRVDRGGGHRIRRRASGSPPARAIRGRPRCGGGTVARADLFPGSGRQAVVLADAEEDAGRPRLPRRPGRRRRQLRRRTRRRQCRRRRRRRAAPGSARSNTIAIPWALPDTSPAPKKDSMGMDYIAGLRRRRYR